MSLIMGTTVAVFLLLAPAGGLVIMLRNLAEEDAHGIPSVSSDLEADYSSGGLQNSPDGKWA
jgi:hypothetical protein